MLSDAGYKKLLSDVRRVLTSAKNHKSVENKLLGSYWTIGQRIVKTGVLDDAAYGSAILRSLADDLKLDVRTMQRAVAFSREYADLPKPGLTWAHFRELLVISDPKERAFYEKLAREEKLSRDRMLLAIESDVFSNKSAAKRKVTLERPRALRYVYDAELLRVIDGDTLLLDIDLGFEVTKRQRTRLGDVNTFSATSKKGRAATLFVAERLSIADRIVIHTKRADLHGRYVAHVFYSTRQLDFEETFDKGHYLNQQLLDQKLAMRM
jgi:hypothetical protein